MDPLRELIDLKTARVISLLQKNKNEFFHLQKISQTTGVPISTTLRIIEKLVKTGIVEKTKVGNFKIYRISDKWKDKKIDNLILEKKELADKKTLSILSTFIKNKKDFFHLQKISKESGVPISTTFRIVNKLVKLKFIEMTKVGNLKIYKIADNKKTARLGRLILKK